ncbi:Hpt domain-containing protein [Parasediminibacterium sp. JCM 36343]|uniref:Hpt domain-containing protein n=1 Tax=Parasediminibacterium sp. JCM 36343 TaxID=3374279 RepID=UPI00397BC45C
MLYNLSMVELMGDNDPAFIKTLLGLFIESIPPDLEALNQAWAEKDWDKVAFVVHKMKPTIDSLGVDTLKPTILALEAKGSKDKLSLSVIAGHIEQINAALQQVILDMKADFPDL